MQNSNLSTILFPRLKESWSIFISRIEKDLRDMVSASRSDEKRLEELRDTIKDLEEINSLSKDNIEKIMDYRDKLLAIDESLKMSFDALDFFKRQNDFDSKAVRAIFENIITSPSIIKVRSEYNRLLIKIPVDKEIIKKYSELIRGGKVDYSLINELLDKYKFDDKTKKDVLSYTIVMLSIKQKTIKNDKEDSLKKSEEKLKFYQDRFKELCHNYQEKKENLKDLLMKCFITRKKLSPQELSMYNAYASNPNEISKNGFKDEVMFKIYTLAFFKIQKDIKNYIDGFSELSMEENDLDDELKFFQEMLNEFDDIADKLNSLSKDSKEVDDEISNNVFFALNAFNHLIIDEDVLEENKSNIKALFQKADNITNARIEGVKTYHMHGVEEEEKELGKNISMIVTSKVKLAYIMVNKSILIVSGADFNNARFDRIVKLAINNNMLAIKKQIALITENNLDYIEMQEGIVKNYLKDEDQRSI